MSEHIEFSVDRQRAAIRALAADISFLDTAEGLAMLEQLGTRYRSVVGKAREKGYATEISEVVNTAILMLTTDGGKLAEYVTEAVSPFAYLGRLLHKWGESNWRPSGNSIEGFEHWYPAAAPEVPEHCTPVAEIAELTFAVLVKHVDESLEEPLGRLVRWLAHNAMQRRSYEHLERDAAETSFPEFTRSEITAVMHICWGVRPQPAETSLMGQFLLDPDFCVSDSPSHSAAVAQFRQQIKLAGKERQLSRSFEHTH